MAIILVGCHELYDYNQIDSKQKVLVVEGAVTNDFGPYSIHLSEAVPFSQGKSTNIKGAKVYIKDNSENLIYSFYDKKNGLYQSDSASFRGKIGNTYTLHITTSDGLEFKSSACTIGLESKIDSIYGFNEPMLLYPKESAGNLEDIYGNAFHIYADISFKANQPQNTRIDVILASPFIMDEYHYIYSSIYVIVPKYDANHNIIGMERKLDGYQKTDSFDIQSGSFSTKLLNKFPIIKTSNDYSSGSKIKKAPLAFMNETGSSEKIDDSTFFSWPPNWIAQIKAYTISNDAFNYYYNVIKQLDAKNNFFEPIPVQLIGNIMCVSDSTKPVFGLFEANSVTINYFKINYNGRYSFSHADRLPPVYRDSISFKPPTDSTSAPTDTSKSPIDTSGFIWP